MEGVTYGENEGDDCDEATYVGWGEPGGEWTQWGWRNEEGSWFQRWGDAYLKERLVICNDKHLKHLSRKILRYEDELNIGLSTVLLHVVVEHPQLLEHVALSHRIVS